MIPSPLTLLLCWLIGAGFSSVLGYLLQFTGELLADAARYGWIGSGAFGTALAGLGLAAAFANGFFIGGAMRLLADRSWPRAGGYALLAVFAAALLGSSAPLRLYPAAGLALLQSPRFFVCAPLGCFLGAYLGDRHREESWLEGPASYLRGWMIWDRSGP